MEIQFLSTEFVPQDLLRMARWLPRERLHTYLLAARDDLLRALKSRNKARLDLLESARGSLIKVPDHISGQTAKTFELLFASCYLHRARYGSDFRCQR